jgi:peptidoglycan/xylan/chitin deacetylase (PgdA/CDA1 family)
MSKLENRGYTVVNWNVDTKDYDTHNLKKEKERYIEAIGDASGGYITLSHDVSFFNVNILVLYIQLALYFRSTNRLQLN